MSDITPTRSAVLELQEERRAMREGYQFLDEKRLLLAAEMLQELKRYEEARQDFTERFHAAALALKAAIERHGLEGVQVYPAARLDEARIRIVRRSLLGLGLLDATMEVVTAVPLAAINASPEAEHCRAEFLALVARSAALAALAGNLERLRQEYRRTERRARALEDVLMPEIEQTIAEVETRLEEMEQEEAIRVRQV